MLVALQTLVEAKTKPSVIIEAVLEQSGLLTELESSKDPQDEVRVENLKELVSASMEYEERPFEELGEDEEISLSGFLEKVSLVADADEIPDGEDHGGVVTLMTLHTAKGLEYEAVFLTGIEEGLLPHRMSFITPGGMAEERRLFYVGITRARKKLHLSLAMNRTTFGESESAMPSRYLQEIPADLIDWRESGAARAQATMRYRNSIADDQGYGQVESSGSGYGGTPSSKPKTEWKGAVSSVRSNEGLQLAAGDMVEHSDFGKGKVISTAGEGNRQTAEIHFGSIGVKRLLVKVAPIEKL